VAPGGPHRLLLGRLARRWGLLRWPPPWRGTRRVGQAHRCGSAALTADVHALPCRAAAARPSGTLKLALFVLLNLARVSARLAPLAQHGVLRWVARAYSHESFASGHLSHLSPGGETPRDRIQAAGVQPHILGENLAYAATVREAHVALMASAPHYVNILYPAYRLVGIGAMDGGPKGVLVVEDVADEVTESPLAWRDMPSIAGNASVLVDRPVHPLRGAGRTRRRDRCRTRGHDVGRPTRAQVWLVGVVCSSRASLRERWRAWKLDGGCAAPRGLA